MTTNEFRDTAATTLARIEAKQDSMESKIDVLSVTLLGNGKPEDGLLFKVAEHHKQTHLATLLKSPRLWIILVCGTIIAHYVLEMWSGPILNWLLAAAKLPPINLG
jgi:hypothetical protein